MNSRKLLVVSLVIVVALALALSGLALARSSNDKAAAIVVSGADVQNSGKFTTLQILNGQQQMGLSVSGTGEVAVTPDISVVTLGVEVEAKTVADAQKQAGEAMSAIMSVLTASGIADKDVQTTNYSIQPIWNYNTGIDGISKRTLEGYQVSNTVNVTIRNVDNTGAIIDAVTVAGGNLTRVNNISFTVDNPKPFNDQARELAIKDAMAKAQQMASLAGVSLGKLLYISESSNYSGPIRLVSASSDSSFTTPISSGQLDISLSVQMVYAIE
jgi:uncharacterized protein YggE